MSVHAGGRVDPPLRTADTFPPVLSDMSIYVDESTGLVLMTGRADLSIYPTEMTMPFACIEATYHTILGIRLKQAAARAALLTGAVQ